MKKYLLLFTLAFLLAGVEKSFACSCVPNDPGKLVGQTTSDDFQKATAVFTGRVLEVKRKDSDANATVKFAVQKYWKGKLSNEVKVMTAKDSAACGVNFEVGSTYRVYATEMNGKLMTTICSPTAMVGAGAATSAGQN